MADEKITLKSLRKHVILTITGMMVLSSVAPVSFYYNTKHTLEDHAGQIRDVKDDIKNIKANMTAIMISPAQNTQEIKAVKDIVTSIESRQEAMDKRIDEIFVLLSKK